MKFQITMAKKKLEKAEEKWQSVLDKCIVTETTRKSVESYALKGAEILSKIGKKLNPIARPYVDGRIKNFQYAADIAHAENSSVNKEEYTLYCVEELVNAMEDALTLISIALICDIDEGLAYNELEDIYTIID